MSRLALALVGLLAGGCDCDATVGAPPCSIPITDPLCGAPCADDQRCGPHLHCVNGLCDAECTQGGSECGAGFTCAEHGRCEALADAGHPPLADAEVCAPLDVQLDESIPTVVLLIDQSQSMEDPFGPVDRWTAVKTALVDPITGVVTSLANKVRFGATLYTSHDGDLGGVCPILLEVPPELDNLTPITNLLVDNLPDDDTPTGEAIDGAVDSLEALEHEEGDPRFIVLATDGEPDSCAVPDPQEGQGAAILAAQNAFALGIRVYILAVGSEIGAGHLQDMANAGAGVPVGGAENEPYFTATDPDELAEAFRSIVIGARSCVFTLNAAVDDPDLEAEGHVYLNGELLGHDDPDGWRLVDPSTLELLGEACSTFQNSPDVTLSADFPCGIDIF